MSPQDVLPLLAFLLLGPRPQQPQPDRLSPPASLVDPGCSGCTGVGGSAGASGGSCGGMISIAITMTDGKCRWYLGTEPGAVDCRQSKACVPQITRTWSGLQPDQAMDFCVIIGGVRFCLDPKPNSGNGSGGDTRDSATMGCDGMRRDFSFEAPSCTMSVQADATCSRCTAFF